MYGDGVPDETSLADSIGNFTFALKTEGASIVSFFGRNYTDRFLIFDLPSSVE